jgi:hypothetical protein
LCTEAAARLEEAGIHTAGDVLARPEELNRIPGLSIAEVRTVLHEVRTGYMGDKGLTSGGKKGKCVRPRVIAGIEEPAVIERILDHPGHTAEPVDPAHPSRPPPQGNRLV